MTPGRPRAWLAQQSVNNYKKMTKKYRQREEIDRETDRKSEIERRTKEGQRERGRERERGAGRQRRALIQRKHKILQENGRNTTTVSPGARRNGRPHLGRTAAAFTSSFAASPTSPARAIPSAIPSNTRDGARAWASSSSFRLARDPGGGLRRKVQRNCRSEKTLEISCAEGGGGQKRINTMRFFGQGKCLQFFRALAETEQNVSRSYSAVVCVHPPPLPQAAGLKTAKKNMCYLYLAFESAFTSFRRLSPSGSRIACSCVACRRPRNTPATSYCPKAHMRRIITYFTYTAVAAPQTVLYRIG